VAPESVQAVSDAESDKTTKKLTATGASSRTVPSASRSSSRNKRPNSNARRRYSTITAISSLGYDPFVSVLHGIIRLPLCLHGRFGLYTQLRKTLLDRWFRVYAWAVWAAD
jgi:hypothetical protein